MQKEMKSHFLSFEIANDLKTIGFDEECFAFYDNNGLSDIGFYKNSFFTKEDQVAAPLYQQALTWLDEVKKIRIFLRQSPSGMISYEIYKWNYDNKVAMWERIGHMQHYDTMKFAYEHAIKNVILIIT